MKKAHYIFLFTLLLTACDTFYGIHRAAQIAAMPDLTRINAAIRSVEGIDSVTYGRYEDSSLSHTFFYSGTNGISGRVFFTTDKAGIVTITVSYVRSNQIPPRHVVDRNYSVMLRVEEQIENQCGLKGLSKSAVETLSPRMRHGKAQPATPDVASRAAPEK